MDGIEPNIVSLGKNLTDNRFAAHDELENKVMDIIRPYTDRKHLPDRWVSLGGVLCPFDVKTTVHCEDNSHDEYLRLFNDGYGMFVVYQDFGVLYADWFDKLTWRGPYPPTARSRSGDPFYRVSGGRPYEKWCLVAPREAQRFRKKT